MIRPIIDSISVRPSGGTSISGSSSRGPETIFEPRDTTSAQTGLRDQADGWWVSTDTEQCTYSTYSAPIVAI